MRWIRWWTPYLRIVLTRKIQNSKMTPQVKRCAIISSSSFFSGVKCPQPQPRPLLRRIPYLRRVLPPRPPPHATVPHFFLALLPLLVLLHVLLLRLNCRELFYFDLARYLLALLALLGGEFVRCEVCECLRCLYK